MAPLLVLDVVEMDWQTLPKNEPKWPGWKWLLFTRAGQLEVLLSILLSAVILGIGRCRGL